MPGRFKDYISTPKQNDYRSLHTTVIGPGSQRVELQIRTEDMHRVAEYGIAAHALYKDSKARRRRTALGGSESRAYRLAAAHHRDAGGGRQSRGVPRAHQARAVPGPGLLLHPEGQLIALPRGATPIDFAYAVHTDIGDTAVGAKINGRIMPLMTELHNGDEVEIIARQGAGAAGRLGNARRHRQGALRHPPRDPRRRAQAICRPRPAASSSAPSSAPARPIRTKACTAALPRLARKSIDDVLAAVGRGEMRSPGRAASAVYPDFKDEQAQPCRRRASTRRLVRPRGRPEPALQAAGRRQDAEARAIPIRGLSGDLPVRFAPKAAPCPATASSAS